MIIGIDIGGSKISIGLSYDSRTLENSVTIPTVQNQRKVVQTLAMEVRKLVGGASPDAIGIACPGPVDKRRGIITEPHHLNWHNLRLVSPLQKLFKCPVILEHDATAGGLAEAKFGAGRHYRLVSYITLSSGIGNSLLLDGEVVAGAHNPEVGSMILDYNEKRHGEVAASFSALTSGRAIERDFGASPWQIQNRTSWRLIARRMSFGIYNVITTIAPDCVILGGGVSTNFKRFNKMLQKDLQRLNLIYPLPPILQAKYCDSAPLLGAIHLASQSLE